MHSTSQPARTGDREGHGMSDTPFWERDDAPGEPDDETPAPVAPDDDIPPYIDPDSVIEIDGIKFGEYRGVAAAVHYRGDDGKDRGTVYIPYDPDNQPPEDDVIAQATVTFGRLEHLRGALNEEVMLDLARGIQESVGGVIVEAVVEALRGGLKINVTASDGDTPEELAEQETVAREAERLFDEHFAGIVRGIANSAADLPEGTPGVFWQDFARDVLTNAIMWAEDETREDLGAAIETMPDDEFETLVLEAYRNAPYITRAMLTLWKGQAERLGELIIALTQGDPDAPETPAILDTLMDAARTSLAKQREASTGTAPAFNADGYGHVDNSIVPVGSRLALVAAWSGPKTQHPEFRFESGAGQAIYALSAKTFPLAADAWRIVDTLDDAHVDTLDYILAKSLANKAARTRDEYGSFTVNREEILDARGIAKHVRGGHKPDNLAEVISHIDHLSQMMVRANVTGYTKAEPGKRGRKETLTVEAPLILVAQTIYRNSLDGEQVPIAWHLRPGDWAIEMERFTPQLATMMQGILKLHARKDAHAKRIGRYLVYQYRVRATQKTWAQPYRIETLLDGAGIEADRKNPRRFRERIEGAFDTLANTVEMGDGPACITSWKYPAPVAATGRGWFDQWLASGVVIMPPKVLTEERYGKIGARPRRPRKLASGQA